MGPEVQLHFRVSEEEMERLKSFAKDANRTMTDVMRQLIRSLPGAGGNIPVPRRIRARARKRKISDL